MVPSGKEPSGRVRPTTVGKKSKSKEVKAPESQEPSSDESRREEILAATLRIAAEEGFDKISVRKVAALAGVSPSLITYHYKTKTELIAEAWWQLHMLGSRQRDETVGRASVLTRMDEAFRLASEREPVMPPISRLDFWYKTARTAALLKLFLEHEDSVREAHVLGLQASIAEGELDPKLAEDLSLLEDFIQVVFFGIQAWSSLHNRPGDRQRALQIGRLFLSRLRPQS